jgi:hypothetical protein
MKRSTWLTVAVLLAALNSGCVTRRYLITSDPPGAVVYRDGQPIGATPVEEPFVYYGKYRFRLVKDGYQPLDVEPELCPPWYQWPGIDFVTENFILCTFRDLQPLHFQLQPLESVRPDDVRCRAEELRQRGQAIQTPPGTEAPPKTRQGQGPPPGPGLPPPVPAPGLPMPMPGLPMPTPASAPGLPAPTPADGVTSPPASPGPAGSQGFLTSRSAGAPNPAPP